MTKYLVELFTAFCATAMFFSGCATSWSPATDIPKEPVVWYDSAKTPIARQEMTIRNFTETGTSMSETVRFLVFGRQANDTRILRPVAVAVGGDGRMAIADTGQPCIHLYVPAEKSYRKITSVGKEQLRVPVSVVFDDDLKLYVSDSANRAIYVFDRAGKHLFTIKKAGDIPLLRPTGLAYSPRKKVLFVVDTLADKVYAYSKEGTFLSSFGEPGDKNGQLNYPTHITIAPSGKLYVVDAMNFRVQIFDDSGAFLSSFGHHGNGSGDFAMPKGIAVDRYGVIYVVDTLFDNIQLFDESGKFLFTIGRRGDGPGEFTLPTGLYLNDQGKLFVCDTYNERVQIIIMTGVHQ